MVNKELNLAIALDPEKKVFEMMISESESGEVSVETFAFNPDKHKSFNEAVGNAVYAWLGLWVDSADEVRDVEPADDEVCKSCAVVTSEIAEPAENQISEEGYQEPYPTW